MAPQQRKSPDGKRSGQRDGGQRDGQRAAARQGQRSPKRPGLASRALYAAAGALLRNPVPVFGGAGFIVLFSFVAANALWYQHGEHPAPFLATRDPHDPTAIAGYRPFKRAAPDDVTTFRIERAASSPQPGSQPGSQADSQTGTQTGTGLQAAPQTAAAGGQGPDPASAPASASTAMPQAAQPVLAGRDLVAEIQRQLSRRGLYDGADDGLTGPKTDAAILFFQESRGLAQTGQASSDLLAALQSEPQSAAGAAAVSPAIPAPQHVAAIPMPMAAPRPAPATSAAARDPQVRPPMGQAGQMGQAGPAGQAGQPARPGVAAMPARLPSRAPAVSPDPVAAAIMASERNPYTMPPAEIPSGSALRLRPAAQPVSQTLSPRQRSGLPASDLVLQIQRGLANIAYADVGITGVADAGTKEAIRRFQKHYRLPENGEPSEMVLRKLKSIGAL